MGGNSFSRGGKGWAKGKGVGVHVGAKIKRERSCKREEGKNDI